MAQSQLKTKLSSRQPGSHCRGTRPNPWTGKLAWPVWRTVRRNLVSTAIFFFAFPWMLPAQETGQPCNNGSGELQIAFAACTQNENAVGNGDGAGAPQQPVQSGKSDDNDWVHAWLRNTDRARASQPHFVSPIVTSHVLLVQQFRYDMSWQQDPAGATTTSNYGASKGLEIVPVSRLEIGIFPPNYLTHSSSLPDGFGDFSFQLKFRAFSATEGRGDYFVGFFFGGSFPTGTPPNGIGHAVLPAHSQPLRAVGPGIFKPPWALIFRLAGRTFLAGQSSFTRQSATSLKARSGR
jgi:hypothetical protein